MSTTVTVIGWINAAAYAAVGALALANWSRHRDRRHAALALALGGLGVVAVAGRAGMVLEGRGLGHMAVIAFVASGWGLVSFRHAVMPLDPRVRALALAALTASGAVVLALGPPRGALGDLGWAHHLAIAMLVVAWSGCVAEPALRFWRAATGRTPVQRRRLRALSLGYLGIVAILVIAVTVPLGTDPSPLRLALQIGSLLLAPLLYASLAPPAWLRRRWRASEEDALRVAIRDVFRGADESGIGRAGLDQALRLLGADTGFASVEGQFLVSSGIPSADARLVGTMLPAPCIAPAPSQDGAHIVAAPLGDDGILAVVSGPFGHVFGQDELETLVDLAASMEAALERIALTRSLRDESGRYEALLHAISDLGVGVAITHDERLMYANEALCEIAGYRRIELLAMPSLLDLIPTEARATVASHHARLLTGNGSDGDAWEAPFLRPDGTTRRIEGASKVLEMNDRRYVLAIIRDVTERRTAAELDRRRASQLAALAEVCQQLAGSSDLERFLPALAGSAARVSRAQRALVAVFEPGSDARWFSAEGNAPPPAEATGIIDVIETEHRVVRSTRTLGALGRPGAVQEVLGVPIARGERLLGAIMMVGPDGRFDDIDENVAVSLAGYAAEAIGSARAFERERAMTQRLRELDQAKNAFLAAVSHELRTPLTSVIGFAQTLQRIGDALPDDERRLLIDRLTANAEKLQGLLADLLDIDRLNRGIIEPVRRPTDVGALTIRAVENFEFGSPRPVHLDIAPVHADVDPPKVERIVENLLANAQRHTTADTPIWIRVRGERDGVLVMVEDAGPGVPHAVRTRIFEPFQQGPSRNDHAPGVGIGLSLVARFAALHGGRAWVEDRPSGGSSFRVWLPARDPHIAPAQPADALA